MCLLGRDALIDFIHSSVCRLQPIEEHVVPEDPPKLDSHPSCGGAQTPPDMMDTDQLTNGSSPPPLTTGLNSPEELALLKKLEDANRYDY